MSLEAPKDMLSRVRVLSRVLENQWIMYCKVVVIVNQSPMILAPNAKVDQEPETCCYV